MSVTILASPYDSDGIPKISNVWHWLGTGSNWTGPDGLLFHIREHVIYTAVAVFVAVLIALPLGLLVGHTGRGIAVVAGAANLLRAIPALGLVVLLVFELSSHLNIRQTISGVAPLRGELRYLIPVEIVLVILAIPSILTNTYAGVRNVDPAVRDAARGMGMTGAQIVRRVELPCALPLIMSGLRSATLQVIATATIAAYAPLVGGLGRPIISGDQQLYSLTDGYPAMLGAALTVAALAVVADFLFAGVQRVVVSPGLDERRSRNRRIRRRPTATAEVTPVHSA
ncbi:MAG TPA: ABC transporter permease subunit [Micromonosporaceae bacterium]|jgi:osmoprotectant transport system permease protein